MKRKVKVYLLKSEQGLMNEALEITKKNDFSLASFLNACIEQYVKSYRINGFETNIHLDVEIKKYKRTNKQWGIYEWS